MAMTSRSKRDNPFNAKSASERIGPGSYSSSISDFKPKHSHAPFGGTSNRPSIGKAESDGPAPGSYSVGSSFNGPAASSAFRSSVSRLAESKSTSLLTPGPGAYSAMEDPLVQNVMAKQRVHRPRSASNPQNRNITWVKVSTAPSIPAASQSYGYEEAAGGVLVRQKPPEGGYTGRGPAESAGPGSYNPSDSMVRPSPHTPNFGASKSDRRVFSAPNSNSEEIGPGRYEIDRSLIKRTASPPGKLSAVFASASNRSSIQSANQAPPPGSYEMPSSFQHKQVPPDRQFFGSTVRRAYEVDPLQTLQAPTYFQTPGPGQYPVASSHSSQSRRHHGAFDSTAERFIRSAPSPDVPFYASEETQFVHDLKKKPVGRYGVFGSTSRRFQPAVSPQRNETGPGDYNPKIGVNTAELRRRDVRSSVFKSSQPRIPQEKDEAAPPPIGSYEVRPQWTKPHVSNKETPFISSDNRFREDKATREKHAIPGPEYNLAPEKRNMSPPKSFNSKAERFPSPKARDEVPGPIYSVSQDPFVKRSFNVTVA